MVCSVLTANKAPSPPNCCCQRKAPRFIRRPGRHTLAAEPGSYQQADPPRFISACGAAVPPRPVDPDQCLPACPALPAERAHCTAPWRVTAAAAVASAGNMGLAFFFYFFGKHEWGPKSETQNTEHQVLWVKLAQPKCKVSYYVMRGDLLLIKFTHFV